MPDTIIESVLTGKLDAHLLLKWLNDESLEDTPEDCILNCCNKSEFVTCFLSFLRNQTDSILQTNSNAVQILQHSTPEKLLSTRRKHRRSISDPTSEDRIMDSLSVKTDRQRSHESPSKDRKRTGKRVKTKLFNEEKSINQSVSSDESRLSTGVDRLVLSSTPLKNGVKPSEYPNLALNSPVTPRSFVKEHHERCDTPRLSHRHSRSQEKSCLGDYMVNVQKSSKKKKSGRSSTDNDDSKVELDLTSSEMFPEIGARKASSLRSEKRRIKPTNIDKSQKSVSLNSFSAESIQTSPLLVEENSAFKQQKIQVKESNNFETERNILKQERHKLMEKFNILNTSMPQKSVVTPQIKITQKNSIEKSQNFIKSDISKVVLKDKLDLLVEIYEILIKNNLIMSLNTEIYFLISILISKQYEDDYLAAESKLNENDMGYLLRTIHNSTYFAVKSLWHQRIILEVILDKSSLKTLGENKKVRSFFPDLAKFLLNCYGLRCEAESNQERCTQPERSNGVVCFNCDTDNADNFPSMLSFHNFKKQRDMFYEIWRWYQDSQSGGSSRSSFRARIKALCAGACPANHAHLAALFTMHMLQHTLPHTKQESKLSKLQRRLTCPNAPESHRLPHFTPQEMFYKEFIINAENESFRVHLRDAIASEITALDATHIAPDERGNPNPEVTQEYLTLSKKLGLLGKFLGYLTSLPYTQVVSELSSKTAGTKVVPREVSYTAPKEKVLENDLARRNYSQPTIDLKGIVTNAYENGRLSITIPWIVHYLSMLDYTSLRIKYYQNLLKILFNIYTNRLKLHSTTLKRNTIIYLKSMLGWLFDLPHFPQELFYENRLNVSVGSEMNIDSCDLVDESIIIELCPHLKDLNVLLSTCRVSQEQKDMGSYRHITPVSLTLNPEDRIKNKEKELQARLEEELLKSQPSSTRRVLELVIERVTSACVRSLSGHTLSELRQRAAARAHCARTLHRDQPNVVESVRQIYEEHLKILRTVAMENGRAQIQQRAQAAVSSLLASAPAPLVALVVKASVTRLNKWINDNWNTTDVLCKDIEGEVKTLLALGEFTPTRCHMSTVDVTAMTSSTSHFYAKHVSAAECVINLKEHVCLLLEGEAAPALGAALAASAQACDPTNMFIRAPTQKAILQLSVDLCVVFVSRKPKEVNESFLSKLHAIWDVCCPDRKRSPPQEITLPERREELSPQFRNFDDDERVQTPISDEETVEKVKNIIIIQPTETSQITDNSVITEKSSQVTEKNSQITESEEKSDVNLEFFDRILCPRNIMLLSDNKCVEVWEAMATVLVFLLKHDYLSEDSLTEQCLAVYRQDWSQNVLESLSTCMKSVSARWSRSSTGKFTLFLDFLAEYCGDMDYEPMEE